MLKNKIVNIFNINLLIVMLVAGLLIQGCGKKDGSTGDNKTDSDKSGNNFSPDKPYAVEFNMSGTTNGTVKAYYADKKTRSESNINAAGITMSATMYYNGGDTMYIVSTMGGMKTGMKFNKNDFAKKKDQIDVTTFREKLKDMDKIGTEELLGKKCDIYRSKDSSYSFSVYKETIPLKISSGNGKVVLTATKYDTDAKVTDDMFEPPKDVTYLDGSNMMKDMKDPKNMENMKDKMKEMEDVMKNYKK